MTLSISLQSFTRTMGYLSRILIILTALKAGDASSFATAATGPSTAPARRQLPEAAEIAQVANTNKNGLDLSSVAAADRPRRLNARGSALPYLPGTRYVMLITARDAAIDLGDAQDAINAIRAIAALFNVDEAALEHSTLDATASHASTPADFAALARLGMEVTSRRLATAGSLADYTAADRLAAATSTWALASHDAALQVKAQGWSHDVRSLCDDAARIAPAFELVLNTPEDADANLAVGRFLAFRQNDWKRGLPLLAKSSDATLATLAKLELGDAAEPHAWAQLGDGWWEQARTAEGTVQAHLQEHACRWYARSLPHAIGPRRALIERRAAEAGYSAADLESMRNSADTPN
jgi:hypothetical protein